MENKQFPYYIEDWILWLGKKRDSLGNEVDFPYYMKWPVKLANYDVTFVVRSCEAIEKGIGFTDRQIDMAIKIISKYQRQINMQLSRDIAYLGQEKPTRLDIREVDRAYSVKTTENFYIVKFPYSPNLVDTMYNCAKQSGGSYTYNKESRKWFIEKTECNLMLLRNFIKNNATNKWVFDATVKNHFSTVDIAYSNIYAYVPYIELVNDKLQVFNSNIHLDNALQNFDFGDDLANAAFRADNYGLKLGPKLTEYITVNYPNICKAITMPIANTFVNNLNMHLRTRDLKEFMTTIRSKHWVFLTHGKRSYLIPELMSDEIPGEKIEIYTSRQSDQNISKQIEKLNTNEVVVFSNNSILTNGMQSMLSSIPMLRLIHLHGN